MKIPILILALWLGVIITPAFSEEGKTINLSEMVKVTQAMKSNETLINDPEALAAMSRIAAAFNKAQVTVPQVVEPTVPIVQVPVASL